MYARPHIKASRLSSMRIRTRMTIVLFLWLGTPEDPRHSKYSIPIDKSRILDMFLEWDLSPLEPHTVLPAPNHDDRTWDSPFFLLKPSFYAPNITQAREGIGALEWTCAAQEEQQTECMLARAAPYPLERTCILLLRSGNQMSARSIGQMSARVGSISSTRNGPSYLLFLLLLKITIPTYKWPCCLPIINI